MIYLLEFDAFDPEVGGVVVERFGTDGFTTEPTDAPANIHFENRISDPGNYRRAIFERGMTSGVSSIGAGVIKLVNADAGIDRLARYAVDGRRLRLYVLASRHAAWADRRTVMDGTMEQLEFGWREVRIRLRDRAAELAEPIQKTDFAGTTAAGGMNEAEGAEDDLKGKPKPTLWGRVFNVSPVLANRFDLIYQLSSRALASVDAVRDNGVPLGLSQDYASIAALRTAAIPNGQYATCLALGLLRTQREPVGDLTVDATEGDVGQRSAALTVRRVLELAGFVEGMDFLADDVATLHSLNPAEVGWWTGTERADIATVVSALLDAIGGWIAPDSLGRFRVGRLDAPAFDPAAPVLDEDVILDGGDGIERLSTSDEGRGVPAAKVTVRYARNWTVQTKATLDTTAATAAVKAFAAEEWRNAVAEDATIKTRHLLATEPEFDSSLVEVAAATAEATRRLGIYGTRRDRYRVPLKAEHAAGIELGDVVTLRLDRFDLADGKPFVVIGEEPMLASGKITLDLYG